MDFLDDLPERHPTHDTAEAAESAFAAAIDVCSLFLIQQRDRHDYGTDVQIEARHGSSVTNFRVHVQLKGTTLAPNADGSISISVERSNLSYLLAPAESLYICYHIPTKRLLVRSAADIFREYEHRGDAWHTQHTLTVRFTSEFDADFQRRLHARVIAGGKVTRDRRLEWTATPPDRMPDMVRDAVPLIDVPDDQELAKSMLAKLYEAGHDDVISHAFPQFAAVLGSIPGAMIFAYMSEINRGINGTSIDESRIRDGIDALKASAARGEIHLGSSFYCQGNGWLALEEYPKAWDAYSAALEELGDPRVLNVVAQCCKNMGSVAEAVENWDKARECFEKAVEVEPDLGEAHLALALWHRRDGKNLETALHHLDRVVRLRGSRLQMIVVDGWRVELLFKTGDHAKAFREIQRLIAEADKHDWIWPWCAKQVAAFGKDSIESAQKAIVFWRAYLRDNPGVPAALREQFFCRSRLRFAKIQTDVTYDDFKRSAIDLINQDDSESALIWDRVGHWAQDDENWVEAEGAFRKAYELEPDRYGYCLGTALNSIGQFSESLPILLAQAEHHQPDALSWFQVAVAHAGVRDFDASIIAYLRALELDPDYDLAWFNLGGMYWNSGDKAQAIVTWTEAITRFPNHSLVDKLRTDFSLFFPSDN